MVESQVRGVEIWGIQFQSGICLIHSGVSCGAGNLMLSSFLQERWMQLSVRGPSSAPGVIPRASGFCSACRSGRVMSGGGGSLGVE